MRDEAAQVILEFVRIGALIRVSAHGAESLTEVVLQGPAAAGEAALRRAVLRKLAYVLAPQRARAAQGLRREPCSRACRFAGRRTGETESARGHRCCTSCSS